MFKNIKKRIEEKRNAKYESIYNEYREQLESIEAVEETTVEETVASEIVVVEDNKEETKSNESTKRGFRRFYGFGEKVKAFGVNLAMSKIIDQINEYFMLNNTLVKLAQGDMLGTAIRLALTALSKRIDPKYGNIIQILMAAICGHELGRLVFSSNPVVKIVALLTLGFQLFTIYRNFKIVKFYSEAAFA